MFELFADFNDLEDGVVSGLQRYARGRRALRPPDHVLVRDGDGNRCWGNVQRVDGELVYVALDDSTWASAPFRPTVTNNRAQGIVYGTTGGVSATVRSGNGAEAGTRQQTLVTA